MRVAIHTQIRQAMRVLIHTHISCHLLVEDSAPKPPLNTEFHSVATRSETACYYVRNLFLTQNIIS